MILGGHEHWVLLPGCIDEAGRKGSGLPEVFQAMMGRRSLHSCSRNLSSTLNITLGLLYLPLLGLRVHTLLWCSNARESKGRRDKTAHGTERNVRGWEKHMKRRGSGEDVLACPHLGHWKLCNGTLLLPQFHQRASSPHSNETTFCREQQMLWNDCLLWYQFCL